MIFSTLLPREMKEVLLFLLLVLPISIQEEMETLVAGVVAAGEPIAGITAVSRVNMIVTATAVSPMLVDSVEPAIAVERISVILQVPEVFVQQVLPTADRVPKRPATPVVTSAIQQVVPGTAVAPSAALPNQQPAVHHQDVVMDQLTRQVKSVTTVIAEMVHAQRIVILVAKTIRA